MFYKFNAHKAKKPEITDTPTDRLAKKMANRSQLVQQGWAGFMDQQTNKLPQKWLKAILLVLVLGSGAYCAQLISGDLLSQKAYELRHIRLADLNPLNLLEDSEKRKRNAAWDYYLDSLESEVKRDSLQNPWNYKP
jgi:hypothetical protein